MKAMRIKVNLPMIKSREEAEAVMNELATAANQQRSFLALRDEEVLALNSKYEVDLAECSEMLKLKTDALRAWAECNPQEFTKGRKSIDMLSGTLGFRTGTPKLAPLSRAFTWDKCIELLRAAAMWKMFVRTKEEVDKEGILGAAAAAQDKAGFSDDLKRVGLQVKQEESFFVEPNLTAVESRQVVKG
jgi:phage host-nuclease inhibitor protein Gam